MKSIFSKLSILLIIIGSFASGCKKFLTVTPIDQMTGNEFWSSKQDVEAFSLGTYNTFRNFTCKNCFFPGTGDLRMAPVQWNTKASTSRNYINYLANNNLKTLLNPALLSSSDQWWVTYGGFGFGNIQKWNSFYQMIQSANIMYKQVGSVPTLSDDDKLYYQAEAVFQRCLAYFFMVRLYGDVPYYTEAYHESNMPRTNMVTVLQSCIKDMGSVQQNLPWTYADPSLRGVRAMRGGALALMMHMNMWLAGFDEGKKADYYKQVDSLGQQILASKAYTLLPIENTKEIFKGRTTESLFEVPENLNYGEQFPQASTYFDLVLRAPFKSVIPYSYIIYDTKFLNTIYPTVDNQDKRKTLWFATGLNAGAADFTFSKFVNVFGRPGEDVNSDDDMIVFRLPDAILLRAEACANLGKKDAAIEMLNMVRSRAGAVLEDPSIADDKLPDDIFYERCKELMGEGHFYYDLIRTKRILDPAKAFGKFMTGEAFRAGAWTWPLDPSAKTNNSAIILNTYWSQ
ncbi:RagB/SusD family nutrient uptake outer membrane protein [Pinibacter soli]|uniref:RagB/SusD family nutrient uptake outer membrane protein n=1 Tax=Pinibacter soli TaxID=3044211 RepID=A0ABT6RJH4_9BACT|nr:RagB/SusD family nutrient uptake outer membrane protein [Pinibacter soli]MDI3322717.1 RagB/SusD family nutrient uptake outer membrane protein [Pinibacter soli]